MPLCHRFAQNGTCRFGDKCRFEHKHVAETKVNQRTKMRQKRSKTSRSVRGVDSKNHIADFFALYPSYEYNALRSFMQEFYAMCDFFAWERDDDDREVARERLQDAMVLQFNDTYGKNEDDLGAWQEMCRALEIDPIPNNLIDCREMVLKVHVNICDLLEAPSKGKPQIFKSEAALSEYTRRTGKIFPRQNVHAGSLLRFLLRQILNPPREGSKRTANASLRVRRRVGG